MNSLILVKNDRIIGEVISTYIAEIVVPLDNRFDCDLIFQHSTAFSKSQTFSKEEQHYK